MIDLEFVDIFNNNNAGDLTHDFLMFPFAMGIIYLV